MIQKGFENLIAWQKARAVNKMTYELGQTSTSKRETVLEKQLRRTAVSISSNIAEGCGRRSKKEFIRFSDIAKGSCNELKSQLYLAVDVNHITQEEFEETFALTDEVSKAIFGLMKHLGKTK
ncbi:four helix bundle protein [Robertkochia marina]|uniref:Four helix bundle protein n=1 Tax=Robertkochia marina TaxID=1227945 RepID=A0A4S3M2W8_9FLAO|nr:four helix bundle protein [Robertkochia marina]THD69403.1 four helix bundle protein [Robertkochia marina]TRZ47336.1 four helix bundle protein [Robertkochia marina]